MEFLDVSEIQQNAVNFNLEEFRLPSDDHRRQQRQRYRRDSNSSADSADSQVKRQNHVNTQRIFDAILKDYNGKAKYYEIKRLFPKDMSIPDIKEWLTNGSRRLQMYINPLNNQISYITVSCPLRFCLHYTHPTRRCTIKNCPNFHICTDYILSQCQERRNCSKSHDFRDSHNYQLLKKMHIERYNEKEIKTILYMSVPQVCMAYNKGDCRLEENCTHLHICKAFAKDECCDEHMCDFSHDLSNEHNTRLINVFKLNTLLDKGDLNTLRRCILVMDKDELHQEGSSGASAAAFNYHPRDATTSSSSYSGRGRGSGRGSAFRNSSRSRANVGSDEDCDVDYHRRSSSHQRRSGDHNRPRGGYRPFGGNHDRGRNSSISRVKQDDGSNYSPRGHYRNSSQSRENPDQDRGEFRNNNDRPRRGSGGYRGRARGNRNNQQNRYNRSSSMNKMQNKSNGGANSESDEVEHEVAKLAHGMQNVNLDATFASPKVHYTSEYSQGYHGHPSHHTMEERHKPSSYSNYSALPTSNMPFTVDDFKKRIAEKKEKNLSSVRQQPLQAKAYRKADKPRSDKADANTWLAEGQDYGWFIHIFDERVELSDSEANKIEQAYRRVNEDSSIIMLHEYDNLKISVNLNAFDAVVHDGNYTKVKVERMDKNTKWQWFTKEDDGFKAIVENVNEYLERRFVVNKLEKFSFKIPGKTYNVNFMLMTLCLENDAGLASANKELKRRPMNVII